MKWLCTLLALWILTLSVQPVCTLFSAEDACCAQSTQAAECEDEDSSDCTQAPPKDCSAGCNPFQVCACCAFTVIQPVPAFLKLFLQSKPSAPKWSVHKDRYDRISEYRIWQPPKIA